MALAAWTPDGGLMVAARKYTLLMLFSLTLATINTDALVNAAPSESEYHDALRIAQSKVLRRKTLTQVEAGVSTSRLSRAARLRNDLILGTSGRSWRTGETWLVASWRIEPSIARMTSDGSQLVDRYHGGALFRFEVMSSPPTTTLLRITCEAAPGFTCPDPKMKELRLELDTNGAVTRKILYPKDGKPPLALSPDGLRSRELLSAIEAYPLAVPELWSAAPLRPEFKPAIPQSVLQAITQMGAKLPNENSASSGETLAVQQDDAFGRPIQIFWVDHELWPRFMRTPSGLSILIRRDI